MGCGSAAPGSRVKLDLSGCRVKAPIYFIDCDFEQPLLVEGCDLELLAIVGTPRVSVHKQQSRVPGILGNGLRVRRDLRLSHTYLEGAHTTTSSESRTAAVWLTESQIGGRLIAVGTVINATGDRAIQPDRCNITGDIRLIRGFRATAEIRLIGAQLGGSLDLAGCQLVSHTGRALDLAEATVGGSIFITDSPDHDPVVEGRLEMWRASINGRVLIRKARLTSPAAGEGRHLYNLEDPAKRLAVVAQGVDIRGELTLDNQTVVTGGMTFSGAKIGAGLLMDGAKVNNANDLALDLSHAQIGSKVSAKATVIRGTVDMNGAQVAGPLRLERAHLGQPIDRYCLTAVGAIVHGDVRLTNARVGSLEESTEEDADPHVTGGINFRGADLDAEGAKIVNPGGTSVNLQLARVAGNIRFCGNFESVGYVALSRAVVQGLVRCDGGKFTWRSRNLGDLRPRSGDLNVRSVAFEAMSATIRGGVLLGWTIDGAVDFTGAHTSFLADRLKQDWPAHRSHLTGFTYESFAALHMEGSGEWSWKARARWLARSDPAPQGEPGDPGPWEQAARALKSHGDAAGSEKLLMEYLRTKRRRRAGWYRYRVLRILDLIFNDGFRGYGYQPLRALIPLAILIVAVGCTLLPTSWSQSMRTTDESAVIYTPQGKLDQVERGESPAESCGKGKVRCFQPWLYAIDTVVPIVDLKQRTIWSPSIDAGGGGMLAWLNIATVIGWAISSLLVVGLARVGSRSLL